MKKKIAYQGRPGAYSHLVCIKAFPNYEPVPCESFEEVFKKTENKETEISLIPIENSQAGRVADIHNLLPMSNLVITGEYFHKVRHHLLGCSGSSLDTIKTAESHLHALAQCKNFLSKNKNAIRHALGKELSLKYLPDLRFKEDTLFKQIEKTNQIFRALEKD